MMRVSALILAAMVANGVASSCNYQAKESCEAAGCSWDRSPMHDGYGCYGNEIAAAHLGAKKYNFSADGASSTGSCVNQNTVLTFGDFDLINDAYGLVATPYNGLSWEELGVTNPAVDFGFTPNPLYGYWKLGALAGNNRATYNNFGRPAIIRGYEGCGFAVGSMAIMSAWSINNTAKITGGRYGGDPFEMQFLLSSAYDAPTIVDLTSWGQMDFLKFESSGGIDDPRTQGYTGPQMTTQFFEILGYDNANLLTTGLKLVDTKNKDHVTWSGMLNATRNQDFRAYVGTIGLHMEVISADGTVSLDFSPEDCSRRKSTATRFSCKNNEGASIIFKKYNGRVASTASSGKKTFKPSKPSSLYTVNLKWTTRDLDLPGEEDTPLVVTLGVPGGIIYQSNAPDCWTKERASSTSLMCYPSSHKLAAKNHQ